MRKRQKRTERNSGKRFSLTQRDINLLYSLARMGYLKTSEIARLFFTSKSGANKRLRTLFDAGFVEVFFSSLSDDNVYHLSKKGKELLKNRFQIEENLFAPLGKTPREHLQAVNSFRISLILATERNGITLSFFKPEWELKKENNPNLVSLIPDALFQIREASGRVRNFALEVDYSGKEDPGYFGKAKVRKYAAMLRSGFPFYGLQDVKVLVVAMGWTRLARLASVIIEEQASDLFLLAKLEDLNENNILTCWLVAEDIARGSLQPFLTSKEG